jgi:hypothetical protein
MMPVSLTRKEIEQARANSEIIERIKEKDIVKVKTL